MKELAVGKYWMMLNQRIAACRYNREPENPDKRVLCWNVVDVAQTEDRILFVQQRTGES